MVLEDVVTADPVIVLQLPLFIFNDKAVSFKNMRFDTNNTVKEEPTACKSIISMFQYWLHVATIADERYKADSLPNPIRIYLEGVRDFIGNLIEYRMFMFEPRNARHSISKLYHELCGVDKKVAIIAAENATGDGNDNNHRNRNLPDNSRDMYIPNGGIMDTSVVDAIPLQENALATRRPAGAPVQAQQQKKKKPAGYGCNNVDSDVSAKMKEPQKVDCYAMHTLVDSFETMRKMEALITHKPYDPNPVRILEPIEVYSITNAIISGTHNVQNGAGVAPDQRSVLYYFNNEVNIEGDMEFTDQTPMVIRSHGNIYKLPNDGRSVDNLKRMVLPHIQFSPLDEQFYNRMRWIAAGVDMQVFQSNLKRAQRRVNGKPRVESLFVSEFGRRAMSCAGDTSYKALLVRDPLELQKIHKEIEDREIPNHGKGYNVPDSTVIYRHTSREIMEMQTSLEGDYKIDVRTASNNRALEGPTLAPGEKSVHDPDRLEVLTKVFAGFKNIVTKSYELRKDDILCEYDKEIAKMEAIVRANPPQTVEEATFLEKSKSAMKETFEKLNRYAEDEYNSRLNLIMDFMMRQFETQVATCDTGISETLDIAQEEAVKGRWFEELAAGTFEFVPTDPSLSPGNNYYIKLITQMQKLETVTFHSAAATNIMICAANCWDRLMPNESIVAVGDAASGKSFIVNCVIDNTCRPAWVMIAAATAKSVYNESKKTMVLQYNDDSSLMKYALCKNGEDEVHRQLKTAGTISYEYTEVDPKRRRVKITATWKGFEIQGSNVGRYEIESAAGPFHGAAIEATLSRYTYENMNTKRDLFYSVHDSNSSSIKTPEHKRARDKARMENSLLWLMCGHVHLAIEMTGRTFDVDMTAFEHLIKPVLERMESCGVIESDNRQTPKISRWCREWVIRRTLMETYLMCSGMYFGVKYSPTQLPMIPFICREEDVVLAVSVYFPSYYPPETSTFLTELRALVEEANVSKYASITYCDPVVKRRPAPNQVSAGGDGGEPDSENPSSSRKWGGVHQNQQDAVKQRMNEIRQKNIINNAKRLSMAEEVKNMTVEQKEKYILEKLIQMEERGAKAEAARKEKESSVGKDKYAETSADFFIEEDVPDYDNDDDDGGMSELGSEGDPWNHKRTAENGQKQQSSGKRVKFNDNTEKGGRNVRTDEDEGDEIEDQPSVNTFHYVRIQKPRREFVRYMHALSFKNMNRPSSSQLNHIVGLFEKKIISTPQYYLKNVTDAHGFTKRIAEPVPNSSKIHLRGIEYRDKCTFINMEIVRNSMLYNEMGKHCIRAMEYKFTIPRRVLTCIPHDVYHWLPIVVNMNPDANRSMIISNPRYVSRSHRLILNGNMDPNNYDIGQQDQFIEIMRDIDSECIASFLTKTRTTTNLNPSNINLYHPMTLAGRNKFQVRERVKAGELSKYTQYSEYPTVLIKEYEELHQRLKNINKKPLDARKSTEMSRKTDLNEKDAEYQRQRAILCDGISKFATINPNADGFEPINLDDASDKSTQLLATLDEATRDAITNTNVHRCFGSSVMEPHTGAAFFDTAKFITDGSAPPSMYPEEERKQIIKQRPSIMPAPIPPNSNSNSSSNSSSSSASRSGSVVDGAPNEEPDKELSMFTREIRRATRQFATNT